MEIYPKIKIYINSGEKNNPQFERVYFSEDIMPFIVHF